MDYTPGTHRGISGFRQSPRLTCHNAAGSGGTSAGCAAVQLRMEYDAHTPRDLAACHGIDVIEARQIPRSKEARECGARRLGQRLTPEPVRHKAHAKLSFGDGLAGAVERFCLYAQTDADSSPPARCRQRQTDPLAAAIVRCLSEPAVPGGFLKYGCALFLGRSPLNEPLAVVKDRAPVNRSDVPYAVSKALVNQPPQHHRREGPSQALRREVQLVVAQPRDDNRCSEHRTRDLTPPSQVEMEHRSFPGNGGADAFLR